MCERCGQQVLWDPTPENLDAYRVVGDLAESPVPAVTAADEVPDRPGLYGWYCNYRLVPDAQPRLPDPSGWNLLYVGIAPSRSTSKATLRSRVLGQHLGGNVGSSTFRL